MQDNSELGEEGKDEMDILEEEFKREPYIGAAVVHDDEGRKYIYFGTAREGRFTNLETLYEGCSTTTTTSLK